VNEFKPLVPGGGQHDVGCGQGKAVQVDPIKPKLKPPGTKRLKLKTDVVLSSSAFKLNLRRYNKVNLGTGAVLVLVAAQSWMMRAGAYTRSHFSST